MIANTTDDMEKAIMNTAKTKLETFELRFAWPLAAAVLLLLIVGLLLLVGGFAGSSLAQESQPRQQFQPKTFTSAPEASTALFQAAQKEDEQTLEAILGAGKEVTSSSDEVEDKLEREQFCKKYQEMHRLVREPDGSTVLYIGAENWPFPIPLVSKNGEWHFDSDRGKREIMFRRIGENEAAALEVCDAFSSAKKSGDKKASTDKASTDKASSEGDASEQYAQSLVSASADSGSSQPALFHGYYFRTMTASPAAGTNSTSSGRKTKARLALVAYPAEYRSSGVETFIVTQDGAVYEKDLGPDTTTAAPGLKARNSSWHTAD
jgi:hypothetical protein